ncbi:MAG: protein kinase [Scytolyngbya sp. HA4215-MV1]|jgi:serine/threonine protein kinase|nr:protein kinase [Scytolyngbya sp. HA4215-MV1]
MAMHPPILPGTLLHHRYRLIGILAQGKIGWTYLAEDQKRVGELCLLKEVAAVAPTAESLPALRETFQQEAALLYDLQHPQIPRFRVVITHLDRLLWVEEYISGKSYRTLLAERLAQGVAFSEAEAVKLLWRVLPVLNYIHRRDIIHGNLSLDTLVVRESDQVPVLTHFGTAQPIAAKLQLLTQTEPESVVGQWGFVASAGIALEHDRSLDFYTLAVTTLLLLTGQEPETLYDAKQQTWQWQQWIPLSPQLTRVLKQMLLQKPKLRYHSAAQIAQALKPLVHAPPQETLEPTLPTLPDPPTPIAEVIAPTTPEGSMTEDLTSENLASKNLIFEKLGLGNLMTEALPEPRTSTATLPVLPIHDSTAFQDTSPYGAFAVAPTAPSENDDPPLGWRPATSAVRSGRVLQRSEDSRESFVWNTQQIRWLAGIGLVVMIGWLSWKGLSSSRSLQRADSGSEPIGVIDAPAVSGSQTAKPLLQPADPTLTAQEQLTQKALRDRRRNLEIQHNFFADLVDEVFYAKHPDLKGRRLSMQSEQQSLRMEWNEIAEVLLNRLKVLSPDARRKLGGYGQVDYDRWTTISKQNNLSIRALQILTDVRFTYLFPEQKEASANLGQFSQVWFAVMEDQLEAIRSKAIVQTIQLSANGLSQSSGVLNAGQAKVYVVQLEKDQSVQFTLQAPTPSTHLSIYFPAQSGDRALLENSTNLTWSGKLPQSGYYEIVIVSNAPETVGYQFKLSQLAEG